MKEYKSEEEFLKDYNPNEFERPSVTSDIILFINSHILLKTSLSLIQFTHCKTAAPLAKGMAIYFVKFTAKDVNPTITGIITGDETLPENTAADITAGIATFMSVDIFSTVS